MAVVLILLEALVISVGNVLGGVSAQRIPLARVIALAGVTSVVFAVLFALLLPGVPTERGIVIGFAAGVVGGLGLPVAYVAYARGPVGVVGATIALTVSALIAVFGIATGEQVTPFRVTGLVLCAVAVVLVTHQPRATRISARGGVAMAILAAVLFAAFVILINAAPAEDGMWPLVGARLGVAGVGLVALAAWRVRRGAVSGSPGRLVLLPILVGFLDVLGNLLLVLALAVGDLLLVAVLAPAAPVMTALIGRLFLGQSLHRWQLAGLVVSVIALPFASF
ncbi:EamA family transporter [uncultured Microbacterium sp.]|uniref:EamA family transporter n=1 Tax=uncultured Microbacterium sp. TaxID=191216 RepID=UPI0035CBCC26